MSDFIEALRARVLVADGAMGTMLHSAGVALDSVLPALSLTSPGLVTAVHEGYVAAGADILLTNTFRASRPRLAQSGLGERMGEINEAGVTLARQVADAAGRPVFVAGSIGPVWTGRQRTRMPPRERAAALFEQARHLAAAGVDLLLLETFADLAEMLATAEACATLGLPIVGQVTFLDDERTVGGEEPEAVALEFERSGLTVAGVNCTLGPQGILRVLRRLSRNTTLPLAAQPNAGLPRMVGGRRFQYSVPEDYFARHARSYVELGACIVGGCCGTGPEHIRAARQAVDGMPPRREPRLVGSQPVEVRLSDVPRSLRRLLGGERPVFGVELRPPSSPDPEPIVRLATALRRAGADFLAIAPATSARAQMSALGLASLLKLQTSIELMVGVTTWDRSLISLQADLLGAQACGVANIVCRTGSPPLQGDYPILDGIWEVDSLGLLELLRSLNNGVDANGIPVRTPSTFFLGARLNPGAADLTKELERARAKVAAGAEYLVTWPLYESDRLREACALLGPARPPIVLSLQPLRDAAEAEFLSHEVPDVHVPDAVVERLARGGAAAGFEIALEVLRESQDLIAGVQLVHPEEPEGPWQEFMVKARHTALAPPGHAIRTPPPPPSGPRPIDSAESEFPC